MHTAGRRAILVATCLAAPGCSWFGGDGKPAPIAPQPAANVYRSPLKNDEGRTGDYRRGGLLETDVAPPASRPATTAPTTTRAAGGDGASYLVLGSVVANVNGSPIYANDLLKQTAPLLRARAKELTADQFRTVALNELKRQRQALIEDELVYAAAQRNTTDEEAREAEARTTMLREQMITQAGGSLEAAKEAARAQGYDFDEMLEKSRRSALAGIYFRKRIFPRAAVTVDEMREYYRRHREDRFTSRESATFHVVRVDVAEVGGDDLARDRAESARARIASGEAFDAISDEFNKQGYLRSSHGLVGPVSKGSYAVDELEKAVWQTPAGQATPVVKSGGAYYVARVDQKTEGRVQDFEEPAVQDAITAALKEQKTQELRRRANDELARDAVINANDAQLRPVVEMAMQLYPAWHDGAR